MKIAGLDVSKSSVSVAILSERLTNPRAQFLNHEFLKLEADAEGIGTLLGLGIDKAVLEPTGVNYSKIWSTVLGAQGVEVWLVGHKQLKNHRKALGLPDKDDDGDALALADYWWQYRHLPDRWLQVRDPDILRMRERVLRLSHLARVQSPIINRARQDLAWQFPEVALVRSRRVTGSSALPLLWGWLAGERKSKKYDRKLEASIGLGINDTVRFHAQRICSLQREEIAIEAELNDLLELEKFARYREVFDLFRLGQRVQSMLLSQIYPFSGFLDDDGFEIVEITRGRRSKKKTRKYLSQRRFKKCLGVAPTRNESGDMKQKRTTEGSSLCRKALWQWVFTCIEPGHFHPELSPECKILHDRITQLKQNGISVRLARSKVMSKAVELLFRALLNGNVDALN